MHDMVKYWGGGLNSYPPGSKRMGTSKQILTLWKKYKCTNPLILTQLRRENT